MWRERPQYDIKLFTSKKKRKWFSGVFFTVEREEESLIRQRQNCISLWLRYRPNNVQRPSWCTISILLPFSHSFLFLFSLPTISSPLPGSCLWTDFVPLGRWEKFVTVDSFFSQWEAFSSIREKTLFKGPGRKNERDGSREGRLWESGGIRPWESIEKVARVWEKKRKGEEITAREYVCDSHLSAGGPRKDKQVRDTAGSNSSAKKALLTHFLTFSAELHNIETIMHTSQATAKKTLHHT